MPKPDFIIIGAMKSATSTVHEQLALQPGMHMSTPKEPNYFSDDEVFSLGESWYDDLFANASSSDICGESSTHYTKLPDYPQTLSRMQAKLSNPKLIYIMRHPIDRLISHYIHQWSQNVIDCDINTAIEKYPELIAYSSYGMQMKPYFEAYGPEAVLPVFTEIIKQSPQSQLDRIANFIGYEGKMTWQTDLKPQNVSKQRIRAFWGYKWLIESSFMTWLRRTFVPKALREKVKNNLTMQERPTLSDDSLQKIKAVIDDDLKQLSGWLGYTLTCDNYLEVVEKNANS